MCRNWMGFTPKIRKQQRRCDCDCITSTYQAWRCDSKADTKQLMGYDHPIWRRRGSLVSIDPSMSRFLVEVSCVAAAPSSSDSGFCMHTLVALAAGPIWPAHFYFVGRTNLPFWVCSRPACCLIFFSHFQISGGGTKADDHEGPATCIAPLCRRCGGNDVPRRRGIHISGRWQITRSRQQYLRAAPIGGGIDPQQQESKQFKFRP